jgi:hypothetical protein
LLEGKPGPSSTASTNFVELAVELLEFHPELVPLFEQIGALSLLRLQL